MTANSPRAMLERLAFACLLALLVAAVGCTGWGLLWALQSGEWRLALLGLAGLALFAAVRPLGYKHLHFRQWEESCEPLEARVALQMDAAQEARAEALAEILDALEEQQRLAAQAGATDIWAVQQLRHRARALLADDPALRDLFAAELAVHPELA